MSRFIRHDVPGGDPIYECVDDEKMKGYTVVVTYFPKTMARPGLGQLFDVVYSGADPDETYRKAQEAHDAATATVRLTRDWARIQTSVTIVGLDPADQEVQVFGTAYPPPDFPSIPQAQGAALDLIAGTLYGIARKAACPGQPAETDEELRTRLVQALRPIP